MFNLPWVVVLGLVALLVVIALPMLSPPAGVAITAAAALVGLALDTRNGAR